MLSDAVVHEPTLGQRAGSGQEDATRGHVGDDVGSRRRSVPKKTYFARNHVKNTCPNGQGGVDFF